MNKVYILVSYIYDYNLHQDVIYKIHKVYKSVEEARLQLNSTKTSNLMSLKIIEQEVI